MFHLILTDIGFAYWNDNMNSRVTFNLLLVNLFSIIQFYLTLKLPKLVL